MDTANARAAARQGDAAAAATRYTPTMPDAPLPDPILAPPCPGLVAAWRLDPQGPAEKLDAAAARAALDGDGAAAWLHFDLRHAGARPLLGAAAGLSMGARVALGEADGHPWIEFEADAAFGGLLDFDAETEMPEHPEFAVLRFALAPGLLVTGRRHRLQALSKFETPPPNLTPARLLARILRAVHDDLAGAQRAIGARLERLEEALLREQGMADRAVLAEIRRDALRLQRGLEPLVLSIEAEGGGAELPEWIDPAGAMALREALQRLRAAARAGAALQERARIAQDQLASLAAEETNRRLFVLSVISAVMLPASLVAGIFGMNVGQLPGVDQDWGFLMSMALIVVSMAGTLALLKLFRLL